MITQNIEIIQKEARDKQAAIKIFDSIEELRLSNDKNLKKRWLLELIQNAKDMTNTTGKVDIIINLDIEKKIFEFSHNGKIFDLKNLYYLLEQVSTKERDKENTTTTGKFGTGFLTTHLLSEIVTIKAIVFDGISNRDLSIVMDRSGDTLDDITASLNDSINQLCNLSIYQIINNFNELNMNTKFIYNLDNEGILIAQEGIMNIMENIDFIFAFCNSINSIEIKHQKLKYKFESTKKIDDNLFIYNVQNNEKVNSIFLMKKEELELAVPIFIKENSIELIKINDNVPRLYCDLPLIGSENFSFPMVINSHLFNVTEPRDGIRLIDVNDERINYNKSLILKAINFFENFVDYFLANSFENMYLLIDFKTNLTVKWLDNVWAKNNIIDVLHKIIYNKKIINTHGGTRIKISEAWFPYHENEDVERQIWELISVFYDGSIPTKNEYFKWSANLWKDCKKITLQTVSTWIQDEKTIENLDKKLKNENVFEWLNKFYQALDFKENHLATFLFDNRVTSFFPNQNGRFCKKDDLFIQDGDICDELKTISAELSCSYREKLLNLNVNNVLDGRGNINQKDVAYKIKQLVQERLNKPPLTVETKKTFQKLYIWFMANKDLAESLFGELYKNKHNLCDDEMLSEIFQKNDTISKILEKHNLLNFEELEELLSENNENKKTKELTKDDLVNLGIGSPDELEKIIKENEFLKNFSHESTPSLEMLEYSHKILERSKKNVIKFLKTLDEYDCTITDELAPTIISGIKKNDVEINIVIRPSDNNKVIIYYDSEKDILDHEYSELWIDDGKHSPRQITLGEVLKVAKISKIPIWRKN